MWLIYLFVVVCFSSKLLEAEQEDPLSTIFEVPTASIRALGFFLSLAGISLAMFVILHYTTPILSDFLSSYQTKADAECSSERYELLLDRKEMVLHRQTEAKLQYLQELSISKKLKNKYIDRKTAEAHIPSFMISGSTFAAAFVLSSKQATKRKVIGQSQSDGIALDSVASLKKDLFKALKSTLHFSEAHAPKSSDLSESAAEPSERGLFQNSNPTLDFSKLEKSTSIATQLYQSISSSAVQSKSLGSRLESSKLGTSLFGPRLGDSFMSSSLLSNLEESEVFVVFDPDESLSIKDAPEPDPNEVLQDKEVFESDPKIVSFVKNFGFKKDTDYNDITNLVVSFDYSILSVFSYSEYLDPETFDQTYDRFQEDQKFLTEFIAIEKSYLYYQVHLEVYGQLIDKLSKIDTQASLIIAGLSIAAFALQLVTVFVEHRIKESGIFEENTYEEEDDDDVENFAILQGTHGVHSDPVDYTELIQMQVNSRKRSLEFMDFLFSPTIESVQWNEEGVMTTSQLLGAYRSLWFLKPLPILTYISLSLIVFGIFSFHLVPLLKFLNYYLLSYVYNHMTHILNLIAPVILDYFLTNLTLDDSESSMAGLILKTCYFTLALFLFFSVPTAWFCYISYMNIPLLLEWRISKVSQISFYDFLFSVEIPYDRFLPLNELAIEKPSYRESAFDYYRWKCLKEDSFIPLPDSYYSRDLFLTMFNLNVFSAFGVPSFLYLARKSIQWENEYSKRQTLEEYVWFHYYEACQDIINITGILFAIDAMICAWITTSASVFLLYEWLLHLRFLPFLYHYSTVSESGIVTGIDQQFLAESIKDDKSTSADPIIDENVPFLPFYDDIRLVPFSRFISVPFLPTCFKPDRYLCMDPIEVGNIRLMHKYVYSKTKFIMFRVWFGCLKLFGFFLIFAVHLILLLSFLNDLMTCKVDKSMKETLSEDDRDLILDSQDNLEHWVLVDIYSKSSFLPTIIFNYALLFFCRFITDEFSIIRAIFKWFIPSLGIYSVICVIFTICWWNYGRFGYYKSKKPPT